MLALWTGLQVYWIEQDERLPDWETARDVGAIEDWAGQVAPESEGPASLLRRVSMGSSGEYPALYPAITGTLARHLGTTDWNGNDPGWLALGWAWLALIGTFGIGRALGDENTGLLATLLLACSPLYAALAREPLMEAGMTALFALAAAAGFAAIRSAGQRRRLGAWALLGFFAGLALLTKQTAALALLPLGLVLVFINGSRWVGPLSALTLCLAVSGPWYLQAFLSGDEYLWLSAQANPDSVGPLRQLLVYPLAFGQQAWPAACVVLFGSLGLVAWKQGLSERTGRWSIPLAVLLCGLLLLMLVPKKYPRLLLPLLPIAATLGALWLQRWPARLRVAALGAVLLGGLANLVPLGPVTGALGATDLGLRGLDERCYQDWIRPADPQGLEWGRLMDLVEEAGGPGTAYQIGSPSWPAPPCAYQTTLHVGEHLQVRLRRAERESSVLTEGGWTVESGWAEGVPPVLVSSGSLDCERLPAFCAGIGHLEEIGVTEFEHPEWSLQLFVYRVTPAGSSAQ